MDETPNVPVPENVADNVPVIDDSDHVDTAPSTTASETQEPVQEPVKSEAAPVVPGRAPHRGYVEFSINMPEQVEGGEVIILPSNLDREINEVLNKIPNVNILDNPDSRNWAQTLAAGLEFNTMEEVFIPTLQQEDAEFKHNQQINNQSLNAASPRFKPIENQNLKGEKAIIRLISHLGLGTLFSVPLWHSGFWITFKPPTESENIEFNRMMIADKIQFGRSSYGLAFSNTVSYSTDRIVNFILNHVYDTSVKAEELTLDNMRQHISCQDIPSLIWGFICTMYPKGFRYQRACDKDPTKCTHVIQETLNIAKLQWTNTNPLTEWQKTHMSSRQPRSMSLAAVTRYKEELTKAQKNRVLIGEGTSREIAFTIKTPNIFHHIDAGHRWIGDIVETVERTVAADIDRNERNDLITRYGQSSALRQYIHWIDSIEYETNIIDDHETIETTLNVLSQDDEIRDTIIGKIVKYINDSTISVIGIPTYDCPNCGAEQKSHVEVPRYENIIPLDVIQLFFDLHTQKLARIATR